MKHVPVIQHHEPGVSAAMLDRTNRLADRLLKEHPEFATPEIFRELVPTTLYQAPSIHVDDFSGITILEPGHDITFFQNRARLRAGDGDVVLACGEHAVDGYESYCAQALGLGSPTWLRPVARVSTIKVAEAAWEDRSVRRELVHRIRHEQLEFLHPHMGTLPVWELALLLSNASHRPMKVIAPPPELTRWANDKVAFTETVSQLFGDSAVPESDSSWNESTLVLKLKGMAEHCSHVAVKLPDSAGGDGNIVFNAEELRDHTTLEIRDLLRDRIQQQWNQESPLLIDAWETDVLCSPSVQTWIPPEADGSPVVEGVFVQSTVGAGGMFVGSQPAHFPAAVTAEIVDRSWLLAKLFQRLGYIGRCSFDLILIGQSISNCHTEFIECNGRWGGTSLPMTLMNRIFGDWKDHPYAVQVVQCADLDQLTFQQVRDAFADDVYDIRSGTGHLILYNPGRLKEHSGIDVLSLGDSWAAAARNATVNAPNKLQECIDRPSTIC